MSSDTLHQPDAALVKASRIAAHYDTTNATIYKWAKEGKIPCVKFEGTVRFSLSAVKAAIEGKGGAH